MRMMTLGLALIGSAAAAAAPRTENLPTGQRITPLAAPGATQMALDPGLAEAPALRLGWAVNAVLSPDARHLAIVTSGTNTVFNAKGLPIPITGGDFVVIYDVTGATPRRVGTVPLPASYGGLAWRDATTLYATGGSSDELHTITRDAQGWRKTASVKLGHPTGLGLTPGDTQPLAAGVAILPDGRVAVANRMNDSVSIVGADGKVRDIDLRPGGGKAGGTAPYWLAVVGDNLWVTSQRDRELIEVSADRGVLRRVALRGVPNRVVARAGRLYVAEDNSDLVEIVDAASAKIVAGVPTLPASARRPRGATPNALTFSADGKRLFVTNGGINAVAVIEPGDRPRLAGLIPTGSYPSAVVARGGQLFVLDTKGNAGPNPGQCAQLTRMKQQGACAQPGAGRAANNYILQLTRSDLLSMPVPSAATLARLTPIALANANVGRVPDARAKATMAALRERIRHVIYIVKENRTYDQVVGDLPRGNGDPRLTQFGRAITPNQHALAEQFVTLDDFRVSGEVSGDGWQWSTAARASDVNEQLTHTGYAGRGGSYDSEGTERNIVVTAAGTAARKAANPIYPDDDNLLAGPRNAAEIDGPEDERGLGYLWDAALRQGKSVRNYGFFLDLSRYDQPADKGGIAPIEDAFASKTVVAIPANTALAPVTNLYFRGFDNKLPDLFRFREWRREFAEFEAKGTLPALSLVRFMNDHMGAFDKAIRGVNTPETQQADNDYAVGLLVEAVASSRFAKDTLIVVIEDDAQDGPDHVDAHRSIAFVAGPYVRRGAVVSTSYTTVDMLRTIQAVLGLGPNNLFDRHGQPMADLFNIAQGPRWSFKARPADILYSTQLPLPPRTVAGPVPRPRHDAAWWAAATRDFDWSREDRNDPQRFNAILYRGLGGGD